MLDLRAGHKHQEPVPWASWSKMLLYHGNLVAANIIHARTLLLLGQSERYTTPACNINNYSPLQGQLAKERGQNAELTQHLRQAKQALVRRGQLVDELRTRVGAAVLK